jgi:hypothetical protein
MPARQHVVAHIGDAVRREQAPAELQDALLHRVRYPRKDAVHQDIVEGLLSLVDAQDVLVQQADIAEPQPGDHGLAASGLPLPQLHADEGTLRQGKGHGDGIAAGRRAEFQDPAPLRRRSLDPQQSCQGRERVRMGVRDGKALVGDLVVARQGRHGSIRRNAMRAVCRATGAPSRRRGNAAKRRAPGAARPMPAAPSPLRRPTPPPSPDAPPAPATGCPVRPRCAGAAR